ncbi:MAG: sigma-70 family RNA polymerase sigma factor [Rubrivivax sp.]
MSNAAGEPITFGAIYEDYFDFVFRAARRLGVANDALDDIVQETFLVVHRRLGEQSGSVRSWIYGIMVHVVRNHRRTLRRKQPYVFGEHGPDPDALAAESDGPERRAEKAEAARRLYEILHELDDEKREVFVLVELEQLPVTEVAEALGTKLNTVYSRLRLARAAFEERVREHLLRDDAEKERTA